MFSKPTNNNRAAQPAQQSGRRNDTGVTMNSAPAAPAKPAAPVIRAASLLGTDLVFEGSVHGDGSLQIDGAIKGDIHVAQLVVGEQAQQNLAKHIDLAGRAVTAVDLNRTVLGSQRTPLWPNGIGGDIRLQPAEQGVRMTAGGPGGQCFVGGD